MIAYRFPPPLGVTLAAAMALVAPLAAQSPDPSLTTVVRIGGPLIDSLPADSTEQALGFFPGVGIDDFGRLVIRGGQAAKPASYLDGVPIGPGYRRAGGATGSAGFHLAIPINAFSSASLTTGVPSAAWGNGASGILAYESLRGRDRWGGTIRYGTDEVFGAAHGLGLNRVEAGLGGPVVPGLELTVAGVVTGQRSAETGAGSNRVPIFVQGGADTVVKVPSSVGSPGADSTSVEVSRFVQFRGDCDRFSGSANPEIADNYGADCQGARNPANAVSRVDILGTLRYGIDDRHAAWLTLAASQDQRRLFDYVQSNVPQQIFGLRNTSRVVTLGFSRRPGRGFMGAGVHAALSFQADQSEEGPLTVASDLDSWSPWGGFLLAPLDMAYGLERFPVDEELVQNYRLNRAGSRRSPYDLENSDQYELVGEFRTNAYGLRGFPEGGGPDGRLTMWRERRTVGVGRLTWRLSEAQALTLGGEYTAYDVTNYNHGMTFQALSDVYIESPSLAALFVEDRFQVGSVTIGAGLRYDRFTSGAERPYLLDLEATSPTFGDYVFFPRTASYRQNNNTAPDGRPLTIFRQDESHAAVSPRVRLGAALSPRLDLYVSAGQMAQAPDFGRLFAGVNTDLSITNTSNVYGDDLGFERVNIAEVGAHQRVAGASLHAVLYFKEWDNLIRPRLRSLQDPLNGRPQDLRVYDDDQSQSVRGVELRVDSHIGDWVHGFVAYSLADAEDGDGVDAPDVRPHTLVGVLQASPPAGWHDGSLPGRIVQGLSLTTAFRFASGTAYTRCPDESGNELVLSGDICFRQFEGAPNGARLPAITQIDLRLSREFAVGGTDVSVFLDLRNVLGADRVQRVFSVTGTTENAQVEALFLQNHLESYFREGSANGAALGDGTINLTFGTGGCANWVDEAGSAAAPSCIYLIRAEERFGNGNGVFDLDEQGRASNALYQALLGRHTFLGAPRRLRFGLSVGL